MVIMQHEKPLQASDFNRPSKQDSLKKIIIDCLKNGCKTSKEIEEMGNISRSKVNRILTILKEEGVVKMNLVTPTRRTWELI